MPPASERRLLGDLAQADPGLLGDVPAGDVRRDVAECQTASV